MHGLDRTTGRAVDGVEHLRQSVADILTTRVNTRVMKRPYGSDYPDIIDMPGNEATLIDAYAAIVGALAQWEPRLEVTSVSIDEMEAGRVQISLKGNWFYRWPEPGNRSVEIAL